MIAFCGLTCSECRAYLATKDDSDEEKEEKSPLYGRTFLKLISNRRKSIVMDAWQKADAF